MQINSVDDPPRRAAKAAGLAYLLSSALIAFVEFAIQERLIIADPNIGAANIAETARNILANQSLFRLGIALDLSYCVGGAVVLAAFYVILRPFGPTIALVAAVSRLLFAGLWALATV